MMCSTYSVSVSKFNILNDLMTNLLSLQSYVIGGYEEDVCVHVRVRT